MSGLSLSYFFPFTNHRLVILDIEKTLIMVKKKYHADGSRNMYNANLPKYRSENNSDRE